MSFPGRDQEHQRDYQVNRRPLFKLGGWRVIAGRELSQPACMDGSSRAGKQGGYLCAPANNDGLWLMT